MPSKRRATPLTPGERRESIINAVLPLLIQHGATVTTRQMAEAAGVAEGTIFKVFPDKGALIREAIRVSMDPSPVVRSLSEIAPTASLEASLIEAGLVLLERHEQVIALFSILRTMPSSGSEDRSSEVHQIVHASNASITSALTELLEVHRDQLRLEPARAAAVFRALVFASAHPVIGGEERLSVREIVDVLTTGMVETPLPDPVP